MGTLASFSIKQQDNSYKKYTISISDKTDDYGNNVVVYEEQTEAQRKAEEKKTYLGNGRVFWTDGKISKAEFKERKSKEPAIASNDESDLPF